jgi:hypothetical protein
VGKTHCMALARAARNDADALAEAGRIENFDLYV